MARTIPVDRQRRHVQVDMDHSTKQEGPSSLLAEPSRADAVLSVFEGFRAELDQHNDRRERLIKTSRDITALSKKLIFHLHRVTGASDKKSRQILDEAKKKRDEIVDLFKRIGSEVEGDNGNRYRRAVAGGLEEFIEAVSFMHFLEHGEVITLDEVRRQLTNEDGLQIVQVTVADYLLGLSDLTGELMRFAINSVGSGNTNVALGVCALLRSIRGALEPFVPFVFNLRKKQTVTEQSLRKIEDVSYMITVRGREYGDASSDVMAEMIRRSLASGGGDREAEND